MAKAQGGRSPMAEKATDRVITVDCQYMQPAHAAAYILPADDQVALVENNTSRAVPLILNGLSNAGMAPEQVRYIIITHLHFDHAGGTSALVRACPNAQVLCHPVAVRHLVDPSRLVASAKKVYGEARFAELYGEIEPIAAQRIRAVEDSETLVFGSRTLRFLHTPGHAKHHMTIHDLETNGMFTGDVFGIMHVTPLRSPDPVLIFSSAPTDFDPDQARQSIRRIRASGIERVYLTHYGEYTDLDKGEAQLLESIADFERIMAQAAASGLEGDALQQFCEREVRSAFAAMFERWHAPMSDEDWAWLEDDIGINAMGLAFRAARD